MDNSRENVPENSLAIRNPYDFDSVSMCSYQSTIYDSEVIDARVKAYERENPQNNQTVNNPYSFQSNPGNQINLSINVVNASNSN